MAISPEGSLYSLPGVLSNSCQAGRRDAHESGSGAVCKLVMILPARISALVSRPEWILMLVARWVISSGKPV